MNSPAVSPRQRWTSDEEQNLLAAAKGLGGKDLTALFEQVASERGIAPSTVRSKYYALKRPRKGARGSWSKRAANQLVREVAAVTGSERTKVFDEWAHRRRVSVGAIKQKYYQLAREAKPTSTAPPALKSTLNDIADPRDTPAPSASASDGELWTDVVQLMRSDVERLGDDPDHAWRLALRVHAALDGLSLKLAPTLNTSSKELSALLALWDGGRCTMSELGDRIGLSRAAITTLADRLEVRGLVKRFPDPSDRRRVFVTVTEQCDKQLQLAYAPFADRLRTSAQATDWSAFANHAAVVRQCAHDAAAEVDVEPRGERDAGDPPKKRGPKPKPTYW